jgi:flagellar basal-body rod modification protein FlgD
MATAGVSSTQNQGVTGQTGAQAPNHDAFQDLNLDTFVKLLVTELSNQDPMQPMDNSQILQQVSQIRAIESNTRLTDTLQSVQLGQAMATASSLLGKTVKGLDASSNNVTGAVDRVSVANGVAQVHIGDKTVDLKNISDILPDGTDLSSLLPAGAQIPTN